MLDGEEPLIHAEIFVYIKFNSHCINKNISILFLPSDDRLDCHSSGTELVQNIIIILRLLRLAEVEYHFYWKNMET